ncbi:DinB family protein [Rhodococcus aerolatus]
MSDTRTPPPWEPPVHGTEAEHLLGALERQRATFRWKADGLDAAGLAVTVGASDLTLGGLLAHLAAVEDLYATARLDGSGHEPASQEEWDGVIAGAAGRSPAELYSAWDAAAARARSAFADRAAAGGLDQDVHVGAPDGTRASLRRLLLDLLEEYARHTGHADLLRETVDGRVGEDPPADWRP